MAGRHGAPEAAFVATQTVGSRDLTAADVAAYHERGGVLHLRGAFPRQAALEVQDLLWQDVQDRLDVRRDDPESWHAGGSSWGPGRAIESVEAARTKYVHPNLDHIFDQLLGVDSWSHAPRWGSGVLITAPHAPSTPWTLSDRAWHWDGPPLLGCWYFVLFSDIEPQCGATLVVEGSGRLLSDWLGALPADDDHRQLKRRFLESNAFLRKLNGRDPVSSDPDGLVGDHCNEDGRCLRVTELCGEAGDVFVMDANILHAAPARTGVNPRFQARQVLHWGPRLTRQSRR